jgi:ribosomal-protein-alanine N-acetyltransferase
MLKATDVHLRLVKKSDLPMLYEKWHDADIRGPHYPAIFVPFHSEFMSNGFWNENTKRMLIVDNQNHVLGQIHCMKISNYSDCVELSYILFDVTKRKKGYTTQAVDLFVDYLFKNSRVNRIQLAIPIENAAAMRVAEKAHFKREGIARGAFYVNGDDMDLNIYALLRKEWLGCH